MYADDKLIKWLLNDGGKSVSEIVKETDIPRETVRDLKSGKAKIEFMRFHNAAKLTKYAASLKEINDLRQ